MFPLIEMGFFGRITAKLPPSQTSTVRSVPGLCMTVFNAPEQANSAEAKPTPLIHPNPERIFGSFLIRIS